MRNLTAPRQLDEPRGTSFDAGCEGLVLFTPSGDRVRLHVGDDGWFYINDVPFGVRGMPPALHASTHAATGGDRLTPAMLGAVAQAALTAVPKAGGVPVLNGDGLLNPDFVAGQIDPARHAETHAAGGADAITPASIRAVADTDPRLADRRDPLDHAAQHAKGQPDALTPAAIGAVAEGDARLADHRFPTRHAETHHKNGEDPLSWADVGSVDAGLFTVRERVPGGYPQLNDLGHVDINLLPQGLPPKAHAETHEVDGIDPVSPESIGAADRRHQHGNEDITGLDAGKIVSGTVDMARLPAGAVERLKLVDDLAALYALTRDDVQNGDTAQTLDSGLMYRVVDDTRLDVPEGYRVYNAGRAAAVPWAGVEGKPTEYSPEAHAARHAAGGTDPVTPDSIGAGSLAQYAEALALARQGVTDAENARVLAVGAQNTANKAVTDAAAANANAETRATKVEVSALAARVTALESGLAALQARLTALEGAAVTSGNIRVLSGSILADGVGVLEFQQR